MRLAVFLGASGAIANRLSSSHVSCGKLRATGFDQIATANQRISNIAPKQRNGISSINPVPILGKRLCHSLFSRFASSNVMVSIRNESGEVGFEPPLSSWKRGYASLTSSPRVTWLLPFRKSTQLLYHSDQPPRKRLQCEVPANGRQISASHPRDLVDGQAGHLSHASFLVGRRASAVLALADFSNQCIAKRLGFRFSFPTGGAFLSHLLFLLSLVLA